MIISRINEVQNVDTTGFTDDQRKAYENIIGFIKSDFNPSKCKIALTGPAGTGKTYLIRAIIKNCGLPYSQIGLVAPTHKATRVAKEAIAIPQIKSNTLQSDLGLKPNYDIEKFDVNSIKFALTGRIKIGDYKVYIVDEASMINRGLAMFLEKKCLENKCKLIYIGDAYQLPPPGENYSSAFRNVQLCELKQIVRQDSNNPILPLLNMLRYDIQKNTTTFLSYIYTARKENNHIQFDETNTKGFAICNDDEFRNAVSMYFTNPILQENVDYVKVVGYTNMCVSSWNKTIRQSIIKDADKVILTQHDLLLSYKTLINVFNEAIITNSEDYIVDADGLVNYVHPKYEIKGFLVKFKAIHGGKVTTPLFVVDHTDMFSVQRYLQIYNGLIMAAKTTPVKLRAQKWKEFYAFTEECLLLTNIVDENDNALAYRSIDYGFALTSHKSQGCTFNNVCVDVRDIVYNKFGQLRDNINITNRLLYVACSRTKNKLYLKI